MKLVKLGKPATSARRITAIAGSVTLLAGTGVAAVAVAAGAAPAAHAAKGEMSGISSSCHLGNGVTHVVKIMFDNVHFFRDNPNVPSDLELMPNLLNFFKDNGTILSNNHTPLIAHTANDILSTYTGLYGDRHGDPIANSYRVYNADGPGGTFNTTDSASDFAYWTAPVFDTQRPAPNAAHDTNPNMVYSPVPPATASTPVAPNTTTPAPWVPYTRAGCDWGAVATANVELENTKLDIPVVFGPNSPEAAELAADNSFGDQSTADYVGVAVHCAKGSAYCANATDTKFGQSTATADASPDLLPNEPGGYTGYQALFGHKYVANQISGGQPNLAHNGYQVTNAAGNLVDLNGNQINGAFTNGAPGFPGFGPINASQTLAYMSDMLESGVPVVNGYVADIHGNQHITGLSDCANAPAALGSGSQCYIEQAQYYNAAFGTFFQRLAADGITPANTEFILNVDEGDHQAGANVGRAVQPSPAGCDGATVTGDTVTADQLCTYPAGSFGELAGNLTGLLATQKSDTTPFTAEADSAPEFYLTGDPGPNNPAVRQFERDVAGLTAANPYTGTTQTIANYIADPVEEGILHMVNADPARTPTFALFAKPDYYLSAGAATCPAAGCVTQNTGFAWNHGDYAAEINSDYAAFAGPGVKNLGIDGFTPEQGPSSAGPNSGQTEVIDVHNPGTWTDTTDIRQTELYLTGLTDDYTGDGQVIAPILATPNHALSNPETQRLAACYKQLNSSVGKFGAYTLTASTNAVESNSANDGTYTTVNTALFALEKTRDALAGKIKVELQAAAFQDKQVPAAGAQLVACEAIIAGAKLLAAAS